MDSITSTAAGNGLCEPSSNPEDGCLHSMNALEKGMNLPLPLS